MEHGGWDLWDWETRLWTGDGMAAWWVFFIDLHVFFSIYLVGDGNCCFADSIR
jgi:hypothetical protein